MSRFDVQRRHSGAPFDCSRLLAAALLSALVIVALLGRRALPDVDANDTALAKDSSSAVDIWVSPDRRTLSYSGPIVVGITERVRAVLDVNPEVATIRLTSPGGRVVEARELGAAIREHELATVAVGSCSSACTIVFMAGRDRLLTQGATLGFHRYHSPDPTQEEAEANMAIDRRYFASRGLPNWFIEHAFSTPNEGMWRPSLEEMRVANVITGRLNAEGERVELAAPRPAVVVDTSR